MKKYFLIIQVFLLLFVSCGSYEIEENPSVLNIELTDKTIDITEEILSYSRITNEILQISEDFKEGKLPYTLERRENREEYERWKRIGIVIENNTMLAVKGRQINYGELKVENGTFVGINLGEFGGGIKFIPSSGVEYEITNENYFGFYNDNQRIFAITGLGHLSGYGHIHELVFVEGKWEAQIILDIGNHPIAFLAVNEELFIVTDKELLLIKDGTIADVLIDNAFWNGYFPFSDSDFNYQGSLAPTTMIYADNSVYIGMYGGVYMYDLNTGMDKWYDYLPAHRN